MKILILFAVFAFYAGASVIPPGPEEVDTSESILQKVLDANPEDNDILFGEVSEAPQVNVPTESGTEEVKTTLTEEAQGNNEEEEKSISKDNVESEVSSDAQSQSAFAEVGSITVDPNSDKVSVFEPTVEIENEPLPEPQNASGDNKTPLNEEKEEPLSLNNEKTDPETVPVEPQSETDFTEENNAEQEPLSNNKENIDKSESEIEDTPLSLDDQINNTPVVEEGGFVEVPLYSQDVNDKVLNQDYDYNEPLYEDAEGPYLVRENLPLSPYDTLPLEPDLMDESIGNEGDMSQKEMPKVVPYEQDIDVIIDPNTEQAYEVMRKEDQPTDGSFGPTEDLSNTEDQGFGLEGNDNNFGYQDSNTDGNPDQGTDTVEQSPVQGNIYGEEPGLAEETDNIEYPYNLENNPDINNGYFQYDSRINVQPNDYNSYNQYDDVDRINLFNPAAYYNNPFFHPVNRDSNKYGNNYFGNPQLNENTPEESNFMNWRIEASNYGNSPRYQSVDIEIENENSFDPSNNDQTQMNPNQENSETNINNNEQVKESPNEVVNQGAQPTAGTFSIEREPPLVEVSPGFPSDFSYAYKFQNPYFYGNLRNEESLILEKLRNGYFDNPFIRKFKSNPLVIIIDTTNKYHPQPTNVMDKNAETELKPDEEENQNKDQIKINENGVLLTEYPHNVEIPYSPKFHPALKGNLRQNNVREDYPWYGNNFQSNDFNGIPANTFTEDGAAYYHPNQYEPNYYEMNTRRNNYMNEPNEEMNYDRNEQNFYRWHPKQFINRPYY